ncbi:MAG TPA: PhzF family phenazine biosynthesis protein [Thermoanaerobaculia bacterium]|jgi:PhzF family phenazine biosynthesis protein|nr:PhzF family phenazine biosynthesis protein [Thermoanaerobaculia bacterium]
MSVRFTHVDAFTSEPFGGNPAAVVVLPAWPQEGWMQAVAAEMNLSTTAYLVRQDGGFGLRWFTPATELALCGHATLASARVLWDEGQASAGAPIVFHTRNDQLTATRSGDWIELDFPATPPSEAVVPQGLAEALGVEARWVGRSRFDLVAVVDDEAAVRAAAPDPGRVRALGVRGVMVTAATAAGSSHDFVSRFFAPGVGLAEDPVTGSAHCCLAPYWAARLGRSELVGYQASQRGGVVRVRVLGDRVQLGGQTTVVARGELLADPA